MRFEYELATSSRRQIGLIALQADEMIESDFLRLLPPQVELPVTRVASSTEVTPQTLRAMEANQTGAAALLPVGPQFSAVAYVCTSATARAGDEADSRTGTGRNEHRTGHRTGEFVAGSVRIVANRAARPDQPLHGTRLAAIERPVLFSNQVLAWNLLRLTGEPDGGFRPGKLWK